MAVFHGTIGDPPGTVGSGSIDSYSCFCACQTCLSGSCCRYNTGRTFVATSANDWACTSSGHDFQVFDPARLYCRKCGTVRAATPDAKP